MERPRTVYSFTKRKVLTSELSLGMYVARLDRPWLETPFLFQGFPITSSEDIDKLKQYCEYVYVDQTLSETSPNARKRYEAMLLTGAAKPGPWIGFLSWLQRIVDKRKHVSLSKD